MRRRSVLRSLGALVAGVALVSGGLVASPTTSSAQQANPYQRGPDPTDASLTRDGNYRVSTAAVRGQRGFGGGTIYYPSGTNETFGAIAVSPGFMTPGALISWPGRRLASHGFVVLIMNPNTILDFPDSRARQLRASLDYMINDSTVGPLIDRNRLGVMGHSMGGGGSLIVAQDNPNDIKAAVPLQPWALFGSFRRMQTPTLVIGAQNDLIASTGAHAKPFYESIPNSTPKAYLELSGQGHNVGLSSNATQAGATLVWFKRFIDNDTRYDRWLCPPASSSTIREYRQNCPYTTGGAGGWGGSNGGTGDTECGLIDRLLGRC